MWNLQPFFLLTLIGNFALFPSTRGDGGVVNECKQIHGPTPTIRLNSHIKCQYYQRSARIRESNNKTQIQLLTIAEMLNFYEFDSNLDFRGYLYVSWINEDINWDYAFYDGIMYTMISPRQIWTPDLAILSAGNEYDNDNTPNYVQCQIYYDGRVVCITAVNLKLRCQTDFNLWPYDRQTCPLIITSWAHTTEQISLNLDPNMPVLPTFKTNGEWNYSVSRISHEERKSNYHENLSSPQISIDFVADRMHSHLRGRYVAPAIIMMVMTLITLWLDPKSIERLAIASLNIIVHLMCIQDLHWALPHNGTTIPNILLFYVNSFVFATVVLLLTFLLGKMKDTKSSTPEWISSSTTLVLRSKIGQLLLLGMLDPKATSGIEIGVDDNDDLIGSKPKETAWTYAVILIGWISIAVFLFSYIIMYAVLIPSTAAKTPIQALNVIDRLNNQFGV